MADPLVHMHGWGEEMAAESSPPRLAARGRRLEATSASLERKAHDAASQADRAEAADGAFPYELRRKQAHLRCRSADLRRTAVCVSEEVAQLRARVAALREEKARLSSFHARLAPLRDDELQAALAASRARRMVEQAQEEERERRLQEHLAACAHVRVALEEDAASAMRSQSSEQDAARHTLLRLEEYERVAEQNRAAQARVAAQRAARDAARTAFFENARRNRGRYVNTLLAQAVGREDGVRRLTDLWAAAQTALGVRRITAAVDPRAGQRRWLAAGGPERWRLRLRVAAARATEGPRHTRSLPLLLLCRAAAALPSPAALWTKVESLLTAEAAAAAAAREARRVGGRADGPSVGDIDVVDLADAFAREAPQGQRQAFGALDDLADWTGEEWDACATSCADAGALRETAAAIGRARLRDLAYDFGVSDEPSLDLFTASAPSGDPPRPPPPLEHPRYTPPHLTDPAADPLQGTGCWYGLRVLWSAARRRCAVPPSRQRPVFGGVGSVLEAAEQSEAARAAEADRCISERARDTGAAVPDPPPSWIIARRRGSSDICVCVAGSEGPGDLWKRGEVAAVEVQVPRSSRAFGHAQAHPRMLRHAEAIFEPLHQALLAVRRCSHKALNLVFCGHGVGGAVATLLAAFYDHLALSELRVRELATFGAPKVFSLDRWTPGAVFPPLAGVSHSHYMAEGDVVPGLLGSDDLRRQHKRLERIGLPYTGVLPGLPDSALRCYRAVPGEVCVLRAVGPAPRTDGDACRLDGESADRVECVLADAAAAAEYHPGRLLPGGLSRHSLSHYVGLLTTVVEMVTAEERYVGRPSVSATELDALRADAEFLRTTDEQSRCTVLESEERVLANARRAPYPLLTRVVGAAADAAHPLCWRAKCALPLLRAAEVASCDMTRRSQQRATEVQREGAAAARLVVDEEEDMDRARARAADDIREVSILDVVEQRGRALRHLDLVFKAAARDQPVRHAGWAAGRTVGWCALHRLARVAQGAARGVGRELEPFEVGRQEMLYRIWEEKQAEEGAAEVAVRAPYTATLWRACRDGGAALGADLSVAERMAKAAFEDRRRHRAAVRIQCLHRRVAAAAVVAPMRVRRSEKLAAEAAEEEERCRHDAASVIVRAALRHRARRNGACTIQRCWRGALGRAKAKKVAAVRESVERFTAVVEAALFKDAELSALLTLQRAVRVWIACAVAKLRRIVTNEVWGEFERAERTVFARADAAASRIARYVRRRVLLCDERKRFLELRSESAAFWRLMGCERRLIEKAYTLTLPAPPMRPAASSPTADNILTPLTLPDADTDEAGTVFEARLAARFVFGEVSREEAQERRAVLLSSQGERAALVECIRVALREVRTLREWRMVQTSALREEEEKAVAAARAQHLASAPQRAASAGGRRSRNADEMFVASRHSWYRREGDIRLEFNDKAEKVLLRARSMAPELSVFRLITGADLTVAGQPQRQAFLWTLHDFARTRASDVGREVDERASLEREEREDKRIAQQYRAFGGAAANLRRRKRPFSAAASVTAVLGSAPTPSRSALVSPATASEKAAEGTPPAVRAAVDEWKVERQRLVAPVSEATKRFDGLCARLRGQKAPDARPSSAGLAAPPEPVTVVDVRGLGAREGDALKVLRDVARSHTVSCVALSFGTATDATLGVLQRLLVAPSPQLRSVIAQSAAASPGAVAGLVASAARCPTLEAIDMTGSVGLATPAGLAALAAVSSSGVRILCLDDCGVGDQGVAALAAFAVKPDAETLSLCENGVTDAGARCLHQSLMQRQTPLRVRLQSNPVSAVLMCEIGERVRTLALYQPRSAWSRPSSAARSAVSRPSSGATWPRPSSAAREQRSVPPLQHGRAWSRPPSARPPAQP
eukprot:TRINITY_DN13151_c0_g1_i2.p1 TRINITY_DN13151_c0_g1~~TRINITY_DN13151_c0_g1_i2.p1  ORF type:complete len:1875 (+),score=544.53 TRINITY_DN13151_c0_g1_i2:59-5683(+)